MNRRVKNEGQNVSRRVNNHDCKRASFNTFTFILQERINQLKSPIDTVVWPLLNGHSIWVFLSNRFQMDFHWTVCRICFNTILVWKLKTCY